MAKQYICPVCKEKFEITLNSNYAINGQLLCSKKCFETYMNKHGVKAQEEAVKVEKTETKVEVKPEADAPKPAVRKRKTNKTK